MLNQIVQFFLSIQNGFYRFLIKIEPCRVKMLLCAMSFYVKPKLKQLQKILETVQFLLNEWESREPYIVRPAV